MDDDPTTYDEAGRLHHIMDMVEIDVEREAQRQIMVQYMTFLRTSEEKFLYLDTNKQSK